MKRLMQAFCSFSGTERVLMELRLIALPARHAGVVLLNRCDALALRDADSQSHACSLDDVEGRPVSKIGCDATGSFELVR